MRHTLLPALAVVSFVFSIPQLNAADASSIGVDLGYRDLSLKPGDDFEGYANGGWRKKTEIPPDRANIGVTYEVFQKAEKRNRDLVAELAAKKGKEGTPERMIADYYAAYMDTAGIEKRGLEPLKAQLEEIKAIKDKTALSRVLGQRLRADTDPINATQMWTENLFGLFVTQGLTEPDRTVPYFMQGGIGIPDREYYISNKPEMVKLRTAYQEYVGNLLKLAGFDDPTGRADRIFALETKIAQAHADHVASQDIHKANNPTTVADLKSNAPGLDWDAYLSAAGLDKQPMFILWQKDGITGESALVGSEELETWKDWLAFHLINVSASSLAKAYDDLHFDFYGKTLQGTPQQRDRWKRAIDRLNAQLGDAVGKIYVGKYFPPSSKAAVQEIVRNLIAAFDKRIDGLSWMAPETKAQAKAKVKTLRVGVGYPEKWRDYAGLVIRADDPVGNSQRAEEWEYRYQLGKLGQPVDPNEWWMTPQTVNALNIPLQNGLNFPAAILEAPYFNPKADAAANYGAIGSVIGHEISHSFDSQGAEFDASGKFTNWWTPDDATHFKQATQRLIEQFNAYEPLAGLHINGQLTLGENIADVAGLAVAFDGYKAATSAKPLPTVGGLTGDQRFFLAFAQAWRKKIRDEALRQQIVTNEHAPDRARAQTVRNIDGWYDAYSVKEGEKLYLGPNDRVKIW